MLLFEWFEVVADCRIGLDQCPDECVQLFHYGAFPVEFVAYAFAEIKRLLESLFKQILVKNILLLYILRLILVL